MNDDAGQVGRTPAWSVNGADPARVEAAFDRVRRARTERDAWRAYDIMLNAIGHNHSGQLHAAAAPAAPVLVRIARESGGWPRRAALEVLVDILAWARPEQTFLTGDGRRLPVADAIRDAVASLGQELSAMAADPDNAFATAEPARHLLNHLAKRPGP